MDASLTFAASTTSNYQDRITRLGQITQSVQPIMHGFGISADQVGDAFDAIRAAADAANIPVETYIQNLAYASTEAKELGYSQVRGIKEIGTEVALLARSTGDAQGAFTKTFQIINRLMRPEDFVRLLQVGINMQAVMAEANAKHMDPLLASIQAVRQRMTDMGLTAQGQTMFLEKLLGGRGLAGYFLSISDQIAHMGVIQDQVFKAHGLNAKDATEKTHQWTWAWQALTASIDHLFTDSIGVVAGNVLSPFVLQMAHLVEGMADFTKANPAFTHGIVDIGLAFAGATLIEAGTGIAKLAGALKLLFALSPPKWFLPVVALMETYEANKIASGGNDIPSLWNRYKSDAAKDFGGGSPSPKAAPGRFPMGRRAAGGPVSGGNVYLVGEQGPEVFVPGMNGSIMPNGGGGSNIEGAIYRGVSEGTKTGIKDGLREFFFSGIGRLAGGYTNGAIGPIAAFSGAAGASAGASGGWADFATSAGGRRSSDFNSPRFSGPVPQGRGGGTPGRWWTPDRMQHAVNYLKENAGLSDAGARGLVARWSTVEAARGPTSVNPTSGAFGIAQWLGARKRGIEGNTDFDAQLGHVAKELNSTEGRAANTLRHAQTDEEGAIGASQYERAEGYNGHEDRWVDKTLSGMRKVNEAMGHTGGTHPLEAALNFHARPTVDHSHIDSAIEKAKHLRQLLAANSGGAGGDSYWDQHWTQRQRLDARFTSGTFRGE